MVFVRSRFFNAASYAVPRRAWLLGLVNSSDGGTGSDASAVPGQYIALPSATTAAAIRPTARPRRLVLGPHLMRRTFLGSALGTGLTGRRGGILRNDGLTEVRPNFPVNR